MVNIGTANDLGMLIVEILLTALDYFADVWIYFVIGLVAGGFVSEFVPRRYLLKVMGGYRSIKAIVLTVIALFPIPLCSIGVIPLVGGFYRMGLSMGVIMAALVMGAGVNPVLFALTADVLGMRVAVTRVIGTFVLAILIGVIAMELEKRKIFLKLPDASEAKGDGHPLILEPEAKTFEEKLVGMVKTIWLEIKGMAPGLIIGIFLTGAIAVLVPVTIITEYLSGTDPVSILLIAGFTIPWYFPPGVEVVMAQAMFEKGMTEPGIVTFLLIATGTSLPNILMVAGFLGKNNAIYYAISWILGVTTIGMIYMFIV
jgi:hypothetical protein